jgi:phage baseplate assembly protein V
MTAARHTHMMRTQAMLAAGSTGKPRLGLVSSYNPATYAVKVKVQPDDIETGWLPIVTHMAGQGWGIYAGPANGDQAIVVFQEGDRETGVCLGFLPSDTDKPPSVPSGEVQVIHKSGAFLKFLSDGTVNIVSTAGINSTGPWNHTGTLHTSDNITCDKTVTATTDVIGGGKSLKNHTHSGVTAGAATSGPPV